MRLLCINKITRGNNYRKIGKENMEKIKTMRNEEGFSLLELVVAVGVLLVLTVGGIMSYQGITYNAKKSATERAASEAYTAAVAGINSAGEGSADERAKQAVSDYQDTLDKNGTKIKVCIVNIEDKDTCVA